MSTRLWAARVAAVTAAATACCAIGQAAHADTVSPPFTVYADDGGLAEGAVTTVTVDLHALGEPAIGVADVAVDSAKEDGDGGAMCTMYLTRPHATPESPRDGDIYVEGEAHAECASTRVEVDFVVGIEWRIDYGVNGSEGSTGTHLQQGGTATCSGASRCPRSGEAIAPWGHLSRCYETGTYHATTVIVSGSYTYRGHRQNVGGTRSATISGTYGRGC